MLKAASTEAKLLVHWQSRFCPNHERLEGCRNAKSERQKVGRDPIVLGTRWSLEKQVLQRRSQDGEDNRRVQTQNQSPQATNVSP